MYLDQMPDLKYTDPLLRYVEYNVILKCVADVDAVQLAKRNPDVANNLEDLDRDIKMGRGTASTFLALRMLNNGHFDNQEIQNALQGLYQYIDSDGNKLPNWIQGGHDAINTKPIATQVQNTNAEIQKKKRNQKQIASEVWQRKRLGDAAVPKVVYAEARQRVDEHLNGGGTREELTAMASQLALDNKLTQAQTDTLLNEIMLKYFDKLNHHNVIEQQLLSEPTQKTKSIFFLWHQLSRKYEVGVSFPLSLAEGAAMAKVSKSTFPQLIKTMRSMEILKRLDKGKQGADSKTAATYTLLVSVGG
tara:strand:+ start:869 stop:1780 length:912 start_codon:yes stop_codon:yes gene_type:complete